MSAILLRSTIVARRSLLYRIRFETAERQATELSMRDAGNCNFDGRPKTTENLIWIRNCGQPTNQPTKPSRTGLFALMVRFRKRRDDCAHAYVCAPLSYGRPLALRFTTLAQTVDSAFEWSWPMIRGFLNFGPTIFF